MIKTIGLLARKSGWTHAQFMKHWIETHAPLALAVPGLRRYVQNHIGDERTRADIPALTLDIDGIAELWFDRPEQFIAGRADPDLSPKLDALEQKLFASVFYREVDETIAVLPNRAPAPEFYYR